MGLTALPAQAATWSSSDQWGSWTSGSYTLYNNIWGSGAGPQTIWANSYSNWGVWANHPATDGIKSYPNVSRYIGKTINSLGTLKSTFSATTPAGGMWTSTYDVWDSTHDHEIMIWIMNWLVTQGWMSGTSTVGELQYGFEISQSSGGKDFRVNSYSVTSN